MENLLIDEAGLPYRDQEFTDLYGRRHVRVGPSGEEKHYVLEMDGSLITEFKDGESVWIDASFDQFNDSNRNDGLVDISYGEKASLEHIRIMGPEDSRRNQYQTVGEYVS